MHIPAFLPAPLPCRLHRLDAAIPLRRPPCRLFRATRRHAVGMSHAPFSPMPSSDSPVGTSDAVVTDAMISAANRAADAAGDVIRRYFRASPEALAVVSKSDESPVTMADREAEDAVRKVLMDAFPGHAVLGEERGETGGESPFTWVIDPIDGTKAFIAGRPTFGTLIALAHKGVPVLGVIDQPISRERWVGVAGRLTTLNGRRVSVAEDAPERIGDATVQATTPDMFLGLDAIAFRHVKRAAKSAAFGSDCYAYALLATGCGDLVVEADLKIWDFAALVPVVTGAGGVMTDWYGMDLTLESEGRVVASANNALHADTLEMLCSVDDPLADMQEGATPVSDQLRTRMNGNGIPKDPGDGHVESMTGYGSAIVGDGVVTANVQLKSVNSRYCDVQVRGPKYLTPFDGQFIALVRQEAVRGKVQLILEITVDGEEQASMGKQLPIVVNRNATAAVRALLEDLADAAGIEAKPTIADIVGFSEVLVRRDPGNMAEEAFTVAMKATKEALADLRSSRRREGAILEYDLSKRTRKVWELLREVEMRASQRVEKQRERLLKLTKDIESEKIDPVRIEYEVTVYADRTDITEEIVRLRAHISLFEMTLLGADEPIGQRLTFLLHEMNREANTLGAKALDAPIAQIGVLIKEEIEKIREQTQNIR
ncbi:unnamed protein product [Chondrus crispus]|uniref:Histidinol-phosphatase n=1 Tax=Chondrus crispus TaxID=2769 RepID=R7QSR5_CHOCR|nr:unnamed protein product [Chondrus crispus]CDF41184.1 unnamed protein product [Chondrus crispus]|eukprot:XP_005711478.1 unnamed protein product [Chondrus crispus]